MRQPKLHKWADKCTEILIYFMVLFSPWAFGTTENWSIWTMNVAAYGLGVLLLSKWIIRWSTGFRPWPSPPSKKEINSKQYRLRFIHKTCNLLTAICMFLLLGYILTSAINARASFNLETHEYTYFDQVNKSLPHTYDARGTWFLFWQYLGLIILFWSTRDWLECTRATKFSTSLNNRSKRLLFFVCLNGGILALECILQRLFYGDSIGKLLFLIEARYNSQNIAQFGPFAYRSNAASYFNIIWPISLGLLIHFGRENLDYGKNKIGSGPELLFIPCTILAAMCPFISSARGGTFVMVGLLIMSATLMIFLKLRSKFLRISISCTLIIGLSSAYYLGWEKFEPRLINVFSDNMSDRMTIYDNAIKMIDDYGFFGSGPGSFEAISQFETNDTLKWESWVHNDYIEFYLTFGILGISLFIFAITVISFQFFLIFKMKDPSITIKLFCCIALFGLSIHAIVDFPLQVYSILCISCIILSFISSNKKPLLVFLE